MGLVKRGGGAVCLGVAFCTAMSPGPARADADYVFALPYYLPNLAGIGVGYLPDYIGSDDYTFGVAPGFRISQGNRFVDLQVNFVSSNLIDHPNWRLGPAAIVRLGRSDVKDSAVKRLPDIDTTLELGIVAGYDLPFSDDPRDRFRISADITHDVLGEHDGYTASLSMRRWYPVARFSALGVSAATTYRSKDYIDTFFSISPEGATASGLPEYSAGAGLRDLRFAAVFIQPLSPNTFVGTGVLYSRILGDAADSPIVATRGATDQWVLGLGFGFTF